jgi:hypothetical protein
MRFYAHPLGNSDRKLGLGKAGQGLDRVIQAVGEDSDHGAATRSVLVSSFRERAELFDRLRDFGSLARVIEPWKTLAPDDAALRDLETRHAKKLALLAQNEGAPSGGSASNRPEALARRAGLSTQARLGGL